MIARSREWHFAHRKVFSEFFGGYWRIFETKKRLESRPIYKCHVIANVCIMSEPDKFQETLEEHGDQLRLESERISTLVQHVLQLEKIVTNLAKTVDIYGTVLANVHPGSPYWSDDSWKQSLAKYGKLNEELTGLVNQLSEIRKAPL
jgi:hypothetical protein